MEDAADEIRFDFDEVFDEDYLYFYAGLLTAEHSEAETDLIWRLLGLEPGMRVLDVACGHGRITNRLAERGAVVAGLDRSTLFLDHARQDAQTRGVQVDYTAGDMCSLPWDQEFDAVINWFTAFGYFDDAGNRQALAEMFRVLKPGGCLLLEHQNRDRILKQFLPYVVTERDGNYLIDRNRYNVSSGRTKNQRTVIKDGHTRSMHFEIRMFTYPELRDWLYQTGFTTVDGFGEDGRPFSLDSRRMIMAARKG